MTDQIDFIRAIIENAHEYVPRLMYADWLEEHGQQKRAEFIRVQCRIADIEGICGCGACVKLRGGGQHHNGPCAVSRCQEDGVHLRRREQELISHVCLEFPYFTSHNWRRGFVNEVFTSGNRFLEDVDKAIWHPDITIPCPDCGGRGGVNDPGFSGATQLFKCYACDKGRLKFNCPLTAHPIERVAITALAGPDNKRMLALAQKYKYDWWPTEMTVEMETTWSFMLEMFSQEWPGIKFDRDERLFLLRG